jgi:hypothetical protein
MFNGACCPIVLKARSSLPRSISGLIDYSLVSCPINNVTFVRQVPMRVNIRAQVCWPAPDWEGARPRALRRRAKLTDVFRSLDRQTRSASGTIRQLPGGDAIPPSAGSGTCLATPCRRPILIPTKATLFMGQDTRLSLRGLEITQLWSCISVGDFTEFSSVMPTIPQSIQSLFNDHQARLAAVAAAPGVVGLSLDLDQISATYLSKAVQILVKPKYAADSNTGASPEDKISKLASSVSRLSKQVRPLAPNDAFYSAFTSGSVAAAQDVFLSIFGLTMPS